MKIQGKGATMYIMDEEAGKVEVGQVDFEANVKMAADTVDATRYAAMRFNHEARVTGKIEGGINKPALRAVVRDYMVWGHVTPRKPKHPRQKAKERRKEAKASRKRNR